MIFSESNKEISQAFAKAWASMQNPKHNASVKVNTKNGKSYTFDYTDLGGIFDEAKSVFKEHGIAILQNAYTEEMNGNLVVSVETMLLHESGEWIKSHPLKMSASGNIQDMGGQVTYMKRYSLSAVLGIATEKDDDANGASGNEYQFTQKDQQQNNQRGLTEPQIKRLFAIGKSAGVTAADIKTVLMKEFNKTEARQLTKQEYDQVCNRLESKQKQGA